MPDSLAHGMRVVRAGWPHGGLHLAGQRGGAAGLGGPRDPSVGLIGDCSTVVVGLFSLSRSFGTVVDVEKHRCGKILSSTSTVL